MQHCLSLCPYCLITVCAWWPACTRCGCFLTCYPLPRPSVHPKLPLSISLCLFFPPPSAITCTSFFQFVHPPPPPPFFPSPTHSLLLHLSCRLFIRCVNNCLPTVVIAPPCQLEVWSKWQCAQFLLACIVQFLHSFVHIAKKKPKSPHCSCFSSAINFWVC